eukprot:EC120095.1.p1 GENE.EC120095.1~~EC120095.1.p1  ORF type:complete len:134 (+),score=15.99 EC120095.1:49-450(+)
MNPRSAAELATKVSANFTESQERVLHLYRQTLKAIPEIIKLYYLEVTPQELRTRINAEFAKHKGVKDVRVIDLLLFKGRNELDETLAMYKTRSHVGRYLMPLLPDVQEKQEAAKEVSEDSDFLKRFYAGHIVG